MGRGWFSITNIDLLIPPLKTTARLNRHRHLIISVILAKARIQLLVQRVSQLRRLTRVSPTNLDSFLQSAETSNRVSILSTASPA